MKHLYCKTAVAILFGCMQGILALGCAWLLKTIVDIITGNNADLQLSFFGVLAFSYYILYLCVFGLSKWTYISVIKELRVKIKERLFTGVLWMPGKKHRRSQAGDVLSKFQYELDLLEKSYIEPFYLLVKNITVTLISVASMLLIQWQMTFVILFSVMLYLVITKKASEKLEKLQSENVQTNVKENSELITMVKGFKSAKDYKQETYFWSRYAECAEAQAKAVFKCNFFSDMLTLISTNLESLLILVIIFIGGVMLTAGTYHITVGGILGITQLVAAVIGPISGMGATVAQIKSTKEIRENFAAFEKDGVEGKREWVSQKQVLPELEKLELRNVSFSFGEKTILENVSLELLMGKKYAVIGRSGSGKTTLLQLLLKQLEPDSGIVCWNGIPYSNVGKAELFAKIGYVAQQPMIFHTSIRENIVAGGQQDAERLAEVLKKSNMESFREEKDIGKLLMTQACDLSGGEKKRVAYARALYRDIEVLVLDEVTSALHEKMALELEKEFLSMEKKLIIHVTHGLSEENKLLYDGIIEVNDKKVIVTTIAHEDHYRDGMYIFGAHLE